MDGSIKPSEIASSTHEAIGANPKHKSELLDEGLDESFPASDPVAISITRLVPDTRQVKPKTPPGADKRT